MSRDSALPFGLKAIVAFHILNLLLWTIGQTGAVVAYDWVAGLGLQDDRFSVDPVIVQVNQGIGLADTLVMFPLFLLGIVGLVRQRFYGAVASWMVFGITLYWPVVYWSTQFFYARGGTQHVPISGEAIAVPALFAGVAAWASVYLWRNRGLFE
jgi:hypothetical protein